MPNMQMTVQSIFPDEHFQALWAMMTVSIPVIFAVKYIFAALRRFCSNDFQYAGVVLCDWAWQKKFRIRIIDKPYCWLYGIWK